MYTICTATVENIGDLLDNVYEEEIAIHKKYCPWVSFKASTIAAVSSGVANSLINPEGVCLAVFGIHRFQDGHNGMWVIPRKGMSFRDRIAFLRRGVKQVKEWHDKYGEIFVPVHESWPAVKELVLFLGFDILPEGDVAVYGGDDYVQ